MYPLPRDERTSMDLPCVRVPALNPGDVLAFGGPAHGVRSMKHEHSRVISVTLELFLT